MTLKPSDILDLPDAPQFKSEPPKLTMNEMIAIGEALLPYWSKQRFAEPPKEFVGEAFKLLPEDL